MVGQEIVDIQHRFKLGEGLVVGQVAVGVGLHMHKVSSGGVYILVGVVLNHVLAALKDIPCAVGDIVFMVEPVLRKDLLKPDEAVIFAVEEDRSGAGVLGVDISRHSKIGHCVIPREECAVIVGAGAQGKLFGRFQLVAVGIDSVREELVAETVVHLVILAPRKKTDIFLVICARPSAENAQSAFLGYNALAVMLVDLHKRGALASHSALVPVCGVGGLDFLGGLGGKVIVAHFAKDEYAVLVIIKIVGVDGNGEHQAVESVVYVRAQKIALGDDLRKAAVGILGAGVYGVDFAVAFAVYLRLMPFSL